MGFNLEPLLYLIIGIYVLAGILVSVTVFLAVRGLQRYVIRSHVSLPTGEQGHPYGLHLKTNSPRH
jgi:hypothetical protein